MSDNRPAVAGLATVLPSLNTGGSGERRYFDDEQLLLGKRLPKIAGASVSKCRGSVIANRTLYDLGTQPKQGSLPLFVHQVSVAHE